MSEKSSLKFFSELILVHFQRCWLHYCTIALVLLKLCLASVLPYLIMDICAPCLEIYLLLRWKFTCFINLHVYHWKLQVMECCNLNLFFLSMIKILIKYFCIPTVYGVEYAFGAHEYSSSGVFEVEPRQCPGFKFRRSIFIGTTCLDPFQVREFMERESANYNGDTYHLIIKNCNHFCHDICYKLTGKSTPKWVNRLAKIGIWL